jgi:hypothetical protein
MRGCPAITPEPSPSSSEFAVGDRVAVRLNERNTTPHVAQIREVFWHYKDTRYYYLLSEGEKWIHKRYFAEDLERLQDEEKS